ncbi:MAG: hypothetical protein A3C02_03775 [Candidatus Andersenbacteria bacterium RIFCSPHIGHO2_02_FULL_45_11]|uniref:Sulfotransferase n=1 Tax=Candidatus Andersenbacteria bacterium RIFCSPHIGHO2_12_FULL_45_11 TaxID=1797281 RepID=A0A1G1X396_9BACT|nr:MAG: hypothetical protein A3C02_03775 [Candidatus Andersenbacteria bacterium RIFCSPHIGHO2_02_FULL_45_11]OGY34492.1 MAG: hypothetical protein A3D99_03285 [Candidatus Andersenbacteria bacterium RIFCSPHIGHO2_12_FULL_45_11]
MMQKTTFQDPDQQEELDRWQCKDFGSRYEDASTFVSNKTIFVVCGCGRSGTSLLRVMLDTHSLLVCGPESLLFLPLSIKPEELYKKFEVPLKDLRSWKRRCASRAEFALHFQEAYLALRERNIWGDKTSRNIHRLEQIWQHFPNAKIIHVVRDPRDVVRSLKTHRKRKVVDGQIVPTGWIQPLDDCIGRWLRAMDDALHFRGNSNYMEMKYEDLVLDTISTLTRVCRHVGVHFEEQMLEFHTVTSRSRDARLFPQNIEATQPISTASIGKWKEELMVEEVEEVVRRTHDYAIKLGYTL